MKLRHIAIIMDGNGRWGKKNLLSRVLGHKVGVDALEKVVEGCIDRNIEILTVYAFSTENWNRPSLEVNSLLSLFEKFLYEKLEYMNNNGVRLIVTGRKDRISKKLNESIDKACYYLSENNKLVLNICFDYSGRQEILDAVNNIISDGIKDVNEKIFNSYLYNKLDYPDLVIRTGGEIRISNFLLWQIAYSELYFTDCLWPDFDDIELQKAIDSYYSRERRYGGLNDK